jgi:molybdopterin-guanine dinucleotide biosynthesis protein A
MGGGDKTRLPLGQRTILDEILGRLLPQVHAVAISANGDAARFAAWPHPVLADTVRAGPLGGILAGMEWAAALGMDALVTVPGDTPFIPPNLVARLAPAPSCAESATGLHHPVALWPVAARAALAAHIAAGDFRVSGFAATLGMRAVYFGGQPDPFFNINTPADLARAQQLMPTG